MSYFMSAIIKSDHMIKFSFEKETSSQCFDIILEKQNLILQMIKIR